MIPYQDPLAPAAALPIIAERQGTVADARERRGGEKAGLLMRFHLIRLSVPKLDGHEPSG